MFEKKRTRHYQPDVVGRMRTALVVILSAAILLGSSLASSEGKQNMKVELVYFKGCPNYSKAAKELEAALRELDIGTGFAMLDREAKSVPDHAHFYGSPSILINEKDLFGASPSKHPSCRLYEKLGYPTKEKIIEMIKTSNGIKIGDSKSHSETN